MALMKKRQIFFFCVKTKGKEETIEQGDSVYLSPLHQAHILQFIYKYLNISILLIYKTFSEQQWGNNRIHFLSP